jgi:hypothetical protein
MHLQRLLEAAAALDDPRFGLADTEIQTLTPLAKGGSDIWPGPAEALSAAELIALVRLFTLAESRLPAWEAGARSPVVPLVKLLRARESYPAELTAWIKANTENRFLPYGSLLERL